jgi:hypothetical protein
MNIFFYILCQFFLSRNILGNTKYAILKTRVAWQHNIIPLNIIACAWYRRQGYFFIDSLMSLSYIIKQHTKLLILGEKCRSL